VTVLNSLDRAFKKAQEINQILLKNLPLTEVQLDEMWNFVKRRSKISEKYLSPAHKLNGFVYHEN